MSIALMQLVEFFLWRAIRTKNDALNWRATLAAQVVLLLQPAILVWLAYGYSTTIISDNVMLAATILYALYVMMGVVKMAIPKPVQLGQVVLIRKNTLSLTKSINNGHLQWGITASWYAKLLYILPVLWVPLLMRDTIYGVVILGTLALTYLFSLHKAQSTWRSLWCFLANILPWAILAMGFLLDESSAKGTPAADGSGES